MDRNLTERLKKLSLELTDVDLKIECAVAGGGTPEEIEALEDRRDDLTDAIWDITDLLEAEAEDEYENRSAKGWN